MSYLWIFDVKCWFISSDNVSFEETEGDYLIYLDIFK